MNKRTVKHRSYFLAPLLLAFSLAAILAACGAGPTWSVTPDSLAFTSQAGAGAPPEQTFVLKNASGGPQDFTISATATWLQAVPASGSLAAGESVTVHVTAAACTQTGARTGRVDIAGAATASVGVEQTCQPAAGSMLWAAQFGSSEDEEAGGAVVDGNGNSYVTGYSDGDLSGGSSNGNVYLARYDEDGGRLWLRQLQAAPSGSADVIVNDLTLGPQGGVYLVGSTDGALPGKSNNGDSYDAYLAHYDSAGNLVWLTQFGTPEDDSALRVAVDSSGNAHVYGSTYGDFDDPNSGRLSQSRLFLAKFAAADGAELWHVQFGDPDGVNPGDLVLDADGNAFVSGEAYNPSGSDNGWQYWDAFVSKFDSQGTQQWEAVLATSEHDGSGSLLPLAGGGVVAVGTTEGTFPGHTSAGNSDAYLAAFDAAGQQSWLDQLGTAYWDSAHAIVGGANGLIYVLGHTWGAFPGYTHQPNDPDVFLAAFNVADGSIVWLTQFGTDETDSADHLAAEPGRGRLLVSGSTKGSFPGFTRKARRDMFLAAFNAADGQQLWLTQYSSDGNDDNHNDDLSALGLDDAGNAYVFGEAYGTYPGQTAAGGRDAFLLKFMH